VELGLGLWSGLGLVYVPVNPLNLTAGRDPCKYVCGLHEGHTGRIKCWESFLLYQTINLMLV